MQSRKDAGGGAAELNKMCRVYLVVLDEPQQHRNHHLLLCVQLLSSVGFVGPSQHKQIMYYRLECRDCFGKVQEENLSTGNSKSLALQIEDFNQLITAV